MGIMVRDRSVNVSFKDANITLEQLVFADEEQGSGKNQHGGRNTTAHSAQLGAMAAIHFQCSDEKDTRYKPAWDHRNRALEGWVAPQRTISRTTTPFANNLKPFFVRTIDVDAVLAGSLCAGTRTARLRSVLREGLKNDMMEFYREIMLLREFKDQNSVSLRKIVKKHRKEVRAAGGGERK